MLAKYVSPTLMKMQISKKSKKMVKPLEKMRILEYNIVCIRVSTKNRLCKVKRETDMNGWLSIREISYKWGVSERCVNQYCLQGRIPGAERFGRSWAIPANAQKPSRLKSGPHSPSDFIKMEEYRKRDNEDQL